MSKPEGFMSCRIKSDELEQSQEQISKKSTERVVRLLSTAWSKSFGVWAQGILL